MSTHEDLFALLKLIADPKAVEANLKKLNDASAALKAETEAGNKAREEANKLRADAEMKLSAAKAAEASAASERQKAQERKDAAEIALSEKRALETKLDKQHADLESRQRAVVAAERDFTARRDAFAVREKQVAALQEELNNKLSQLKTLAA